MGHPKVCLISWASCHEEPETQAGAASPRSKVIISVWFIHCAGSKERRWSQVHFWFCRQQEHYYMHRHHGKWWLACKTLAHQSVWKKYTRAANPTLSLMWMVNFLWMRLCSCARVVVDNRSTMSYYSHQLTWLDQLMTKVNCNCTAFNDEVKDIVYQFESRGWWIFSKVTKQFQTKCLWPTSGWKNMNTKKVDPSMQKNWWHTQKISTWKW